MSDAEPSELDALLSLDPRMSDVESAPMSYGGSKIADLTKEVMNLVVERVSEPFVSFESEEEEGDAPVVDEELARRVVDLAGPAATYVTLCAMDRFQTLSQPHGEDVFELEHDDLMWSRSRFCEYLAIGALNLLLQDHGPVHALTHVLAAVYPNHNATSAGTLHLGEDTRPESAIEQGLECGARRFVEHKLVIMAVDLIWNGQISYSASPSDADVVLPQHMSQPTHSDIGVLGLATGRGRLRMPVNQVLASQVLYLAFIVIFTWVVNNRVESVSTAEWILFVCGLGYAWNEARQMTRLGLPLYFRDTWNFVDLLLWASFLTAASLRVYSFLWPGTDEPVPPIAFGNGSANGTGPLRKHPKEHDLVDMYYDLLSLTAVPLWLRILSAFDQYEFIATTIIIVQRLFRDSLTFLVLLIPICMGFTQALLGLEPKRKALGGAGPLGVFCWLLRGFIGDVDFESASEFDATFGPALYGVFILVGYIILLNLLIAIYCESYSAILEASTYQFRSQRLIMTLERSDRNQPHPFPVPFGLFELVLVTPVYAVAFLFAGCRKPSPGAQRVIRRWHSAVWWVCCLPLHILVAIAEEIRFFGYRVATHNARVSSSLHWISDHAPKADSASTALAKPGDAEPLPSAFEDFVGTLVDARAINQLQAAHLIALHGAAAKDGPSL